MRCWGKEYNFISKVCWQRRCQTNVSNLTLIDLDARFFYRTNVVGEGWGNKVRRLLILQTSPRQKPQARDLFISSSLPSRWTGSWTKALSQAKGQNSLKQAIMYVYNNKNKEKQIKKNSSNIESKLAFSRNISFLGILLTWKISSRQR